jgi:hypothetical protein
VDRSDRVHLPRHPCWQYSTANGCDLSDFLGAMVFRTGYASRSTDGVSALGDWSRCRVEEGPWS